MKRWLILSILIGVTVHAQVHQKLTLEREMESRISEMVRVFDPFAIVSVKVTLKPYEGALPGLAFPGSAEIMLDSLAAVEQLNVKSISVNILTQRDSLPKSLVQTIERTNLIDRIKPRITITKFDDEVMGVVSQRENSNNALKDLSEKQIGLIDNFFDFIKYVMIIATVFLAGFFLIFIWNGVKQRTNLGQLIEAIRFNQTPAESMKLVSSTGTLDSQPRPSLAQSSAGERPFDDFSNDSILSLLSDCYWCEKDNYASWIWNQLAPSKQQWLLDNWPPGRNYSQSISRLHGENLDVHSHPSYLKPLPIFNTSQNDLAKWVTEHPSGWTLLSPLRKESLPITLEQKIKYVSQSQVVDDFDYPSIQSELRKMRTSHDYLKLTIEEETLILQDPRKVPESARTALPSLIWWTFLPESQREELLNSLSAQDLARVWNGPEEVLSQLARSLNPKKLELVKSYRSLMKDNERDWTLLAKLHNRIWGAQDAA